MNRSISPIWLKASLLGSVWGSVEIIVGSFLHNARLPFAGTLLASIGICLLIAGRSLWKEPGLVWRAGVVCALMKSISPSAVIIGPMVGILAEALCLELFLRLFRGRTAGLIAGGGIAACLPFLQVLIGLIITYGLNIAKLYEGLYSVIAAHLGSPPMGPYGLLALFLLVNLLLGIAAAVLGLAVGRSALRGSIAPPVPAPQGPSSGWQDTSDGRKYSIVSLVITVVMLPLVLLAIGGLPLQWSSLAVCSFVLLMLKFYPGAWKRFGRPRLWAEFILITLLAGLLLGGLRGGDAGWTWNGLVVGLQMVLRAVFMLTAFTIVSIELRNPAIIGWFLDRGMRQLPGAMEVAFDALPTMVAHLGDQRRVLRHPVRTLSLLLMAAKERLRELETPVVPRRAVLILTGERGAGKTTAALAIAERMRSESILIGGIASPVVWQGQERLGYDVVDLRTSERMPLCRRGSAPGVRAGPFLFSDEAVAFGQGALDPSRLEGCALVVIDEIGPLELEGNVWARSLEALLGSGSFPLLLIVRSSVVEDAVGRWSFTPEAIWTAGTTGIDEMMDRLNVLFSQQTRDNVQ
jgi:nucleoside-triphosphatase THEP1